MFKIVPDDFVGSGLLRFVFRLCLQVQLHHIHALETGVPATLPNPDGISPHGMARWRIWRLADGHETRNFVSGALMGLLFVAGVMNLAWVAAITAAVVIEKLHLAGVGIGKLLGGLLIVAGTARIVLMSFN
jgi:hypothetical protein